MARTRTSGFRGFHRVAALLILSLAAGCGGAEAPAAAAYAWTRVASPTTLPINAVTVLPDGTAWAVGHQGLILHHDGTRWSLDPQSGLVPGMGLWDVCARDRGHVWAVGWDATVIFFDGTSWSVVSQGGVDQALYSCAVEAPFDALDRRVLAGSIAGHYLVLEDDQVVGWSKIPEDFVLRGLWSLDADHLWVAGDKTLFGGVVRRDLDDWSVRLTDAALQDVKGSGPENVWAVGSGGATYRFDGNEWIPHPTGAGSTLTRVAVVDDRHAWTVGLLPASGAPSTLLFFDGTAWSAQATGTNVALHGVATLDGSKVWAVGDDGTILLGTPNR